MESEKKRKRPRTNSPRKEGPLYTSSKYKKPGAFREDSRFKSSEGFSERKKVFKKSPFANPELNSLADRSMFRDDTSASKRTGDSTTRLNKYIASSGICSRREADEFIKAGLVSVNDVVITEMGVKVKPGDVVKYNGQRIRAERKIYILLNKPRDYVTTADDPEGRKTVMDLIKDAGKERVYPVGRLDRNTTGVLLLTNDGEIASRLTHPKFEQKKIYHIFLDRDMLLPDFKKLAAGLELSDGFIKPDGVSFVNPDSKSELGIEIHSGKNRIVRRMLESLGYKVIKLDRVYFAGLTKKNVPRGRWRFLNEKEISYLRMTKKQ